MSQNLERDNKILPIRLITPHKTQLEVIKACLDPSIMYVTAIIGRRWGKTTAAENITLYWILNDPGCTVYWISPTNGQAEKVYDVIVNAVFESGCIKKKKKQKGAMQINFTNGSTILFGSAQSEDNLRGDGVNYMIIDEAAFVKKSTIEIILMPMLTTNGKKLLLISTPKGKNHIYEWFLDGKSKPRYASFRFNTYDSPYASAQYIQDMRDRLSPVLFQQEIEAEFVDSSAVFNNISELLCLLDQPEPSIGEDYYAGIDIGLINDPSVVAIFNSKGDLIHYERWENIEAPKLIKKIKDLDTLWQFKNILIENNNQGLVIYQTLKDDMPNLKEFNTNMRTKPEIINDLIGAFNMKSFKLIKDEYLRIELEAFIFKQNDNGKISFLAENGFHDDLVMAIAIGRQSFKTNLSSSDFGFFENEESYY